MDLTDHLQSLDARRAQAWPADVPRELPATPLGEAPITEHLRHWVQTEPNRLALVFYGAEITFAQLDELSDRFCGWLQHSGVEPGDRVGVMLPNVPQFVIAFYGILKAGAVHVPVSPMSQHLELEHELRDADVRAFLGITELRGMTDPVLAELDVPVVATTSLSDMLPAEPAFPVPDLVQASNAPSDWADIIGSERGQWAVQDLDALAALNYTGGTTGLPKGCEHTQRHMLYTSLTMRASSPFYDEQRRAVALIFIPVFWIGGQNPLVSISVWGTTIVLLSRWDADAWLTAIETYRTTEVSGTVDNFVEVMARDDIRSRDLSSVVLARAMSFVKVLTPEIRREWRDLVGSHTQITESGYGMTETHTMDTITWGFQHEDHDLRSTPVFCGVPVPGTDIVVVDEQSREPLPAEQAGVILVRTPSLMTGYWRNPEATAQAISADGWFDTGDKGLLDQDGCLHFLGRDKDMIKVNGMSVFPSELEAILARHPEVVDSAVVSAPDERRGQVPVAFVRRTPDSTLSADELRTWCAQNMAVYKVPIIELVEDFPLTATGKIRKVDLAEPAAEVASRRA